MQCSPYNNDKFFTTHKTCFSKAQLVKIAKSLKLKHLSKYSDKQTLWNKINEYMIRQHGCDRNNEHCWLKYYPNFEDSSHVPQHPIEWFKDPQSWLSNIDIMNVMVQYEKKHKTFKFIGVFPIDFASTSYPWGLGKCVSEEICKLKMSSLTKKYSSYGAVFNLDKHHEPGSHWVAVYFNVNKSHPNYGFFFFDSNATAPPVEIVNLYKSIKAQLPGGDNFVLEHNHVRKQFKNTECGMFCLYFLTLCLKNIPFKTIVRMKFLDDDVFKLRKSFFRTPVVVRNRTKVHRQRVRYDLKMLV